jgi:hypothetical protein
MKVIASLAKLKATISRFLKEISHKSLTVEAVSADEVSPVLTFACALLMAPLTTFSAAHSSWHHSQHLVQRTPHGTTHNI